MITQDLQWNKMTKTAPTVSVALSREPLPRSHKSHAKKQKIIASRGEGGNMYRYMNKSTPTTPSNPTQKDN